MRYTVEKAGTLVPQIGSISHGNGANANLYMAIYVKRAGEAAYTALLPQNAGTDGNGWLPVYGKAAEGVSLTTAADLNVVLDDVSLEVGVGDEILYVFANNGTAQSTGIRLYPSLIYTAVKE